MAAPPLVLALRRPFFLVKRLFGCLCRVQAVRPASPAPKFIMVHGPKVVIVKRRTFWKASADAICTVIDTSPRHRQSRCKKFKNRLGFARDNRPNVAR